MKNEVGIEGSPLSSSPPTPPSPLPVSVGPGHEKYNFSASPSPSPPFSPPLSARTSSTDNFLFIHNNAHLVLSSSNTKSQLPHASFSVDLPRFEDDPESQITSCLKDFSRIEASERGAKERKAAMGEGETKMAHSPVVTYASVISLLTLCPPFVILLWYTMVHADGSVSQTWDFLKQNGLQGIISIWPKPTAIAWKIIACFAVFEAVLQLYLPGKRVEGPLSPAGNRPVYKANGLAAYAVTLLTYLSLWWFGIFNPKIVYNHLGEIFSALIFGSFIFCIFLHIKGHLAPSSTDSGSSGNIIIDFYWGMELYPRIGQTFDIKVFTNCRFGMMSWAVLALTYCITQYEENGRLADSMLVSTVLMLVYITKFYWWEAGYWSTMDIAHDRAGFYICWGCLVWIASVYTSPGMYLVNHPINLGTKLAIYVLVAGILCIYINYDCDRQRQEFRRTNGKCLIWGKAPSKIVASYTTTSGETKSSLLLTSGWWGLSRHFHYIPEILAAFFWTVPALFNHFLPYFYVIFLIILLFDRAKRDDDRCRSKYGKYWKVYCEKVPSRIIPGIF